MNDIDVEDYLKTHNYNIDKNKKTHSGSFNIVKFYTNQTNQIILRESIEPITDINTFFNEVNFTLLMSNFNIAPFFILNGINKNHKGFIITEAYDFTLFELTHKTIFIHYKEPIKFQLDKLLDTMIYNASLYNTDMKIENIVVKLRKDRRIDLRMIDFDPYYCKQNFNEMYENNKIEIIDKEKISIYQKAWKILCLIFIEEHLRCFTTVTLLKNDIKKQIIKCNDEHILAMNYLYESDVLNSIREHYYQNYNLHALITKNVPSNEIISNKIQILLNNHSKIIE